MRSVAQSEAIASLPALLDHIDEQPVAISREGHEIAVLVSMRDYEAVRRANWDRMNELSRHAGTRFEAHAAELGVSPEELLDNVLRDDG